jgi:hypothetical protein
VLTAAIDGFEQKHGKRKAQMLRVDERAKRRLWQACDSVKQQLSSAQTAIVEVSNVIPKKCIFDPAPPSSRPLSLSPAHSLLPARSVSRPLSLSSPPSPSSPPVPSPARSVSPPSPDLLFAAGGCVGGRHRLQHEAHSITLRGTVR